MNKLNKKNVVNGVGILGILSALTPLFSAVSPQAALGSATVLVAIWIVSRVALEYSQDK